MTGTIDDTRDLERGYRRLVAFYPRSFRRENGDEIVAVLLATAASGQRRPGLPESFDLLRGALRMHLGLSRSPRTVLYAARLMCLGALAEGVARYAPAAVAASGVTWAIGLTCVILICWKQSWPYYESQSA